MTPFYWEMIRKYTVAFSSIINDIHVQRYDSVGTLLKDIKVPITFAGKSKLSYILHYRSSMQNKETGPAFPVSTILPRIGFIMSNMVYDSERKLNNFNELPIENQEITKMLYDGVPYNFTFDVSILAKNLDDLLQIIEQIAVQFTPSLFLTVKELPELGITRDVSVTLDNVAINPEFEFGEEEERSIIGEMSFTLKGFLYRPIKDVNIIEIIDVNLKNDNNQTIVNINEAYNELTEEIDETITEY